MTLDALLIPLIILLSYFCVMETDIRRLSIVWSSVFMLDAVLTPLFFNHYTTFYLFHFSLDIITLISAWTILWHRWWRLLIISAVCLFSAWMNMYEHMSPIQTFIYEYRDQIQWWLVEILVACLLAKVTLRPYVYRIEHKIKKLLRVGSINGNNKSRSFN